METYMYLFIFILVENVFLISMMSNTLIGASNVINCNSELIMSRLWPVKILFCTLLSSAMISSVPVGAFTRIIGFRFMGSRFHEAVYEPAEPHGPVSGGL
jgi:hypothetical protein